MNTEFKTPYVLINDSGIDLIKNYLTLKHLDFENISHISIKRGFIINNWILTLIIGILLFGISTLWGFNLIKNSQYNENLIISFRSYFMIQIIPWILSIFGIILIITSLKKNIKLFIYTTDNKKYRISLKELDSSLIMNLKIFLENKVNIEYTTA